MTLIHFTQQVTASYDVTISRGDLIALLVDGDAGNRDFLETLSNEALVTLAVDTLATDSSMMYDEFAHRAPDISLDGADVDDWQFSQFIE